MQTQPITEDQYFDLQAQYERTPAPADSFSPSGEHYRLVSVLNHLGFYPMSKEEAWDLAEQVLANGWQQ